ncbi:hypothetical protein DENIS_0255 [Desulfonema ishimotonii]|uniref:DUF1015 domain-containing protein n=1 Tax=Desulfonema ishimotonii TaxID=45657 RepID=A0A401FQS5_9BACT|nr:DUF1015 domain-containing protein [Desulfonema ishimotonii]GBC59318.1 hypothetical protein DENIS_0255 [Desulfonema ishimotonii]
MISGAEQAQAYARHPQNIIRLILGKTSENDTETDNRYTRTAKDFEAWQQDSILIRDTAPGFYLTATEFNVSGKTVTRFGLLTRVRLEPFEKGIILPHEKTFSRIKSDRLALMNTCHANFSPIFSLYEDNSDILGSLRKAVADRPADTDFTDILGHRQKLWRITDPDLIQPLTAAMQAETLFIADGHHRYETALNYRNQMADSTPDFPHDHPANFIMMYLASMKDPGLIVLPAHRMLKGLTPAEITGFISKAETCFDITPMPFTAESREAVQSAFLDEIRANAPKKAIGVLLRETSQFHLMTLKPGIMEKMFGDTLPPALAALDVTVLTRLIFMELLGFDQARLDNEQLIGYSSIAETALDDVLSGGSDAVFILNPTPVAQVRRIASEGLIMPRKSTYFYPKVITGQVINPLIP